MFKKNKDISVNSPAKGKIIPLSEVPDEVFSQELLGAGFAVIPDEGKIFAPVSGTISVFYKTGHALVIETKEGLEVLIHVGLETVNMNGAPFEALVKEEQEVQKGDLLLNVDLEEIKKAGYPIVTPVILSNMDDIKKHTVNLNSDSDTVLVQMKK